MRTYSAPSVESGGTVDGLPVHTFPSDDGGVDMTCPTEIVRAGREFFETLRARRLTSLDENPLMERAGAA